MVLTYPPGSHTTRGEGNPNASHQSPTHEALAEPDNKNPTLKSGTFFATCLSL